MLNNETTHPHRVLARRVEELRQLALLDGSDGRREFLDPETFQQEAVKCLERADAEETTTDASGAGLGKGRVADVVVYVGRIGVGLIWLGVQLIEADQRWMAAVGGIAQVDDVDVGDEGVFEGAGCPADLHSWCYCSFQTVMRSMLTLE